MFDRKKEPVLTATTCNKVNKLCQAIEVLTGERTSLARFDFNTGYGAVFVAEAVCEVMVVWGRDDLIQFKLELPETPAVWYHALFEDDGNVKVSDGDDLHQKMTIAGRCTLCWIGTSKDDRHEEPLFLEDFEYCAKVRGTTLQELLNAEVSDE